MIILTCEHASNRIPQAYRNLFHDAEDDLKSHKGWDIGAEMIFDVLAKELGCFSIKGEYSRLLIELNRSLSSPFLFSYYTKDLSIFEKAEIIQKYYKPYQDAIFSMIEKAIAANDTVLHLSIHSFTPVLNGVKREADIGILYDPKRTAEKIFSNQLVAYFRQINPAFVIRKNYPYRGNADGLTRICRRRFGQNYVGIEIEFNQDFFMYPKSFKLESAQY